MNLSKRLEKVPPYLFFEISRKIAAKKQQGIDVVSFGIGDPDLPTPAESIAALRDKASVPGYHRYPESDGLPSFRQAVARWYHRRFGIALDPDSEIISLIGAKEGIGHAALAYVDPGDVVLVPDPGYPVYSVGTWFAGGECHWMPLLEENGWLPDLAGIPTDVAKAAKTMWLCYPNNPTGAVADASYFESVVEFARAYDVMVLHDACYSDVTFDGFRPISFLETPGAMDVGMEFHSLSKTYNMTGWRLGMAVGNSDLVKALLVVKSNLDSGVPGAIQEMGIAALEGPENWIDDRNLVYERRRDRAVEVLESLGLRLDPPKAGLYVWARVPEGYTSAGFTELLLEERNVVVTPGNGFGPSGEGYIRLSLTIDDESLEEGLNQIAGWEIPSPAGEGSN